MLRINTNAKIQRFDIIEMSLSSDLMFNVSTLFKGLITIIINC